MELWTVFEIKVEKLLSYFLWTLYTRQMAGKLLLAIIVTEWQMTLNTVTYQLTASSNDEGVQAAKMGSHDLGLSGQPVRSV